MLLKALMLERTSSNKPLRAANPTHHDTLPHMMRTSGQLTAGSRPSHWLTCIAASKASRLTDQLKFNERNLISDYKFLMVKFTYVFGYQNTLLNTESYHSTKYLVYSSFALLARRPIRLFRALPSCAFNLHPTVLMQRSFLLATGPLPERNQPYCLCPLFAEYSTHTTIIIFVL